MRSCSPALFLLSSLAIVGCSTSHGPEGDCSEPAPTGCREPDPSGCCRAVAARCADGEWVCPVPGSLTFSCEGPCGTEVCTTPEPSCRRDLGGGCCGEPVDPVCLTPAWSCPTGSVRSTECSGFAPECDGPTACSDLTEAQCVGAASCVPLYDDFCCPLCLPIGACADCSRIQMYECATIADACTGAACAVAPPACGTETPDCSTANPTTGNRCDVPGCVARIEAGCLEACLLECVPVTGSSCTALCDELPPDCPAGTVAETDGFCWTGFCIADSVCARPDLPPMP